MKQLNVILLEIEIFGMGRGDQHESAQTKHKGGF
jgi:hypothetical protein